jgi:hypothetical protein
MFKLIKMIYEYFKDRDYTLFNGRVDIISLWLLLVVFVTVAYAADIDVDSDNNSKVDGAAEVYGAGWNADVDAPQKNDVYDKIETLPCCFGISRRGGASGFNHYPLD